MYKHIKSVLSKALDEVDKRRRGEVHPLKTGWNNLDRVIGGIEFGRVYTFAGLSGSGKSTMLEQLKRNLFKHNPEQKMRILSLDFEMLPEDQFIRAASAKIGKSHGEILSYWNKLDDQAYKMSIEAMKEIADYPIFVLDVPLTPSGILKNIDMFMEQTPEDEAVIVTLDNLSFVEGQDEKSTIDLTMKYLVLAKKKYAAQGRKLAMIVISQLNRGIEDKDRVSNALLHYPTKKDIFASSSVYFSSDVVIITHKPSVVPGIDEFYGPPRKNYLRGLPVYNPNDPSQPMIYWHIIKQRFGVQGILMMVDNLKFGRIDPYKSN